MIRYIPLLLVAVVAPACGHGEPPPAPLGAFSSSEERGWSMECPGWIVTTQVCGREPWTPYCALSRSASGALYGLDGQVLPLGHGALATHRIRCDAPHGGWTLWTDRRDRILGGCGDPNRFMSGTEYMRRLLDAPLGHDIDRVTPQSVLSIPGLHTWTEPVGLELRHDPDGSIIEDRSKVRPGPPAGCLEVILDE